MILLARLVPLVVASVLAADVPAPDPALAADADIRAAFVGKAACPPQPWPVSFGPYEFHADGSYFRGQDLVSVRGRYRIAGGRICVTVQNISVTDFCLAVLKDGDGYAFRYESKEAAPGNWLPQPVTPCPLP